MLCSWRAPFQTVGLRGLSPVRGNINRMVFTISGFGPQRSPSLFGGSLVAAGLLTTDGMLVGLRRRLVRIGEETWKQGVRFRIAEIPPYYEKSGPSWLGTRRWLVVRRCTLAGNLAKLSSRCRQEETQPDAGLSRSFPDKRLSPGSGISAFTPAQQRSTSTYVGAKIRFTGLRAYFPASRMGRST